MYTTIVVGTDGSDRALDAVRRAGELAAALEIGAIHVVSACVPIPIDEMNRIEAELPKEFHELLSPVLVAQDRVNEAEAELSRHGVEAIHHEVTGDPSNAILEVADAVDADLVVVGARGLGALARFLRGSVSTRVAHHSRCDVLVVEHNE